MISFLFWNLMGGDQQTWPVRKITLLEHLIGMAARLQVDVFLFAESAFDPAEVVAALNQAKAGSFHHPPSNSRRIQLITRLSRGAVVDQFNDSADGRLTIRRVTTSNRTELLLAATHFQSQLAWSKEEQALHTTGLQQAITKTEDDVGHQHTILVGDLNMNPFDLGLVGAHALNAVMDRRLARPEGRSVAGRTYRYFYNPMWGHFGDRTPGPSGTFYRGPASPGDPQWHLFDQVLLRPALMDRLAHVEIIEHDGKVSLLTNHGRPRKAQASDHLPLFFRLDL